MKSNIQKKPSKARQVHAELRNRIVGGRYLPGERMPTFDYMEQEFAVSRIVLQHAVEKLRLDGFVQTMHRKGVFVAEAPPHLCRVALLFADAPESPAWSRMNTAMVNETKRLEREHADWRFEIFDGLADDVTGTGRLAMLGKEIRNHRLAGVICTPKTFELCSRTVLKDLTVPRALVCAPDEWRDTAPIVGVDSTAFYRRALQRLAEKGRRRIAILHMADTTRDIDHAALFAELELPLYRPWIQWVGRSHPCYAENIVTLLLDAQAEKRPDGLIVADDNLIEHAAAGIVSSGMRVGTDLDAIAHCNWPWPLPSVLPFERIGFDATDILRRAIECIVAERHGEAPLAIQKVSPLFEWEFELPSDVPSPKRN